MEMKDNTGNCGEGDKLEIDLDRYDFCNQDLLIPLVLWDLSDLWPVVIANKTSGELHCDSPGSLCPRDPALEPDFNFNWVEDVQY